MARKSIAPKFVLQANIIALLEHVGITPPTLAKRAGIDRKSVNNMINARFNPDYVSVDKVARVFGLNHWQMLRPIDPARIKQVPPATDIERLMDYYYDATGEERETIMRVAGITKKR